MSWQHGGHHHWDMILKSYSYLLIQFVFCIHLHTLVNIPRIQPWTDTKLPDALKSHYQLSSPNHTCSSAVFLISLQCYVILDKGHALAGTPADIAFRITFCSPHIQERKIQAAITKWHPPLSNLLFPLIFLGLLIWITSVFIAAFSTSTCENRWTGITWLVWRHRYKVSRGRTQSWLCAPAACSNLLHQYHGRAHMAAVQLHMHFGISPIGFKSYSCGIFTMSTLEMQALIQRIFAECLLIAMSWSVKTEMS